MEPQTQDALGGAGGSAQAGTGDGDDGTARVGPPVGAGVVQA
ncbi:hypothetical protein MY8738_009949, partial [Beauveria namnaoensis]